MDTNTVKINQKINLKLFALVILSAVVPTLIVGILTLRISEQTLFKQTEVKLSVANTTARKQLIDWVAANKEEMTYLSVGIPGVTDDIKTLVNQKNPTTPSPAKDLVAQDLKRFLDNHKSFFEIFLLDPHTGEVIVSTTPGQEGKLHADQQFFIQGIKRPFVQNVYYSLSYQKQLITISAPVHDTNGAVLGIIAGHLNLDQLNAVLKQPSGLGATVKSYAVNAFKLIVAGLPVSNRQKENYRYNELNTLPVTEGLQGKSGVATYPTFSGVRVVGSFLPIPELDLLVVTEIDEQEVLQPIQSLLYITYTITAITLGVTLLVATYLMRLFLASIDSYRKRLEASNKQLAQTQKDLEAQNAHLGILTRSLEVDKEHVERLLHSLNEGVLAVEKSGMIWLCNTAAERLLGQPKEKLIHQHIDDVFKVFKDREQIKFGHYSQEENKENSWFEINTIGSQKFLSLMTAPIVVGASGQSGWVVTFSDVTKEAQLESMKLDFVSMAAHELRTPLTSIRGYSSLLHDELSQTGTPSAKDYVNKLTVSASNLGDLIENLLNVSRIERNMFEIETVPTDLMRIIEAVIASLNQQATIKHIALHFNHPETMPPLVMADSFRISQVVTNLLANAINYTQEGGTITITIAATDNEARVSVADNGPGIPSEALPKLFTKFFRVSGVLEQGSKGTGLGLYITKSIIEMHHGKIWAESTLGNGATFTFTLPLATNTDVEAYKKTTDTAAYSGPTHRGIILNTKRRAMHGQ